MSRSSRGRGGSRENTQPTPPIVPEGEYEVRATSRCPDTWQHFDYCVWPNGIKKARCKKCGLFMSEQGNTTLKIHAEKSCSTLKFATPPSQANMSQSGSTWIYDNDLVREMMCKFVIQECLPFDHFDNPRLTKLIQETLQPRYRQVSRTTLRSDAFKMWDKAKLETILGFTNLQTGVSLTTDVWSAPNNSPHSYLVVTAHWINPTSWLMMKRTTSFELFGHPHTGGNLFRILDSVINGFKLDDKLISISFDNASNNTNAVNTLKGKFKPMVNGTFFHTRCVAHIINLAVQDGLKEINDIKAKFKAMLQSIFSYSNPRYNSYLNFCRQIGCKALGPNYDVPHRWNSTCIMFESALRQKDSLVLFHNRLVERNKATALYESDWNVVEQLVDYLQVFNTATTLLSGVYYPTSPLVLNQLWIMTGKMKEYETRNQMFFNMITPMKAKFVKYFKELPAVFTCAAALSPCNVGGVESAIRNICENLDLNDEHDHYITNEINRFNNNFRNLFDVYVTKYGTSSHIHNMMSGSTSSGGASASGSSNPTMNLFNTLRAENSKRAQTSTPSSELGNYTATDFISQMSYEDFQNLDILAWWKGKETQFPILAAMARDILSVQASTVASESAFSVSGRVISIRRTRLSPPAVEVCICLKDYLDGVERVQHATTLETELTPIGIESEILDDEVNMGISQPMTAEDFEEEEELDL